MFTFNGIGTKLYGSTDNSSDGSYVTTKWFVFVYLPVVPLESYRVVKEKSTTLVVYSTQKYKTINVPLHKKQVARTYLLVYGMIGIIVLLSQIL
jgi:hypothetical protein